MYFIRLFTLCSGKQTEISQMQGKNVFIMSIIISGARCTKGWSTWPCCIYSISHGTGHITRTGIFCLLHFCSQQGTHSTWVWSITLKWLVTGAAFTLVYSSPLYIHWYHFYTLIRWGYDLAQYFHPTGIKSIPLLKKQEAYGITVLQSMEIMEQDKE